MDREGRYSQRDALLVPASGFREGCGNYSSLLGGRR